MDKKRIALWVLGIAFMAIIVFIIVSPNPFGQIEEIIDEPIIINPVIAEPYAFDPISKEGFTLVPTMHSKSGIDSLSSFILTIPDEASIESFAQFITIDNHPDPLITPKGENEYLVTPAISLAHNSLYVFRMSRDEENDITWAFQTAKKFQITSVFPANQSTYVPINTGIEITFSDEGYTLIDDFFSISPNVSGKFRYHKNTAIFVPESNLDYETIYTVTIKAGIRLEGTDEVLTEDIVYAFETEAEQIIDANQYWESVYFRSQYIELPTIQPPVINYRLSSHRDYDRPTPSVSVYRLPDVEESIEAVRTLMLFPYWSNYAREEDYLSTDHLSKIMNFDVPQLDDERWYTPPLQFPESLPQGFYLVEINLETARDQMVLQINDLPTQIIMDDEMSIFWVHDIDTGEAAKDVKIHDKGSNKTYLTDANGIAVIDHMIGYSEDDLITITALDGKSAVWIPFLHNHGWIYPEGNRYNPVNAGDIYWSVMQLDRTLFKADDTVNFWGYAHPRDTNESIEYLTATLTQGGWWGWWGDPGPRDILHRQVVAVEDGIFVDEMKLPNLDQGFYMLSIQCGEQILGSMHFSVRDYVKPPYTIDLSVDKQAVFVGEPVTFTAKAGFFEGTPLPELDISYRLNGSWNGLTNALNEQAFTDHNGEITITEVPKAHGEAQGQAVLYFTTEASLPEIGWTYNQADVKVFINDIWVTTKATRDGKDATILVDVNTITLDRLNDGTAEHAGDFLDAAVADQTLSVEIYREYWEKINSGNTYYCFIEKKNFPIYRYERREEKINQFEIKTGVSGTASYDFTLPDRETESYYAQVMTKDGNGRTIKHRTYIGIDWSNYYWYSRSDDYHLHNDNISYRYHVGDEVNLTVKRGMDVIEKGNFLFVALHRGIVDYQAGKNPYTLEFSKEHVPNVQVNAYYFDGFQYQSGWSMTEYLRFDFSQNDLELKAVFDQEVYQPGDMCSIVITAKDQEGNPLKADVNLSFVDEALFALMDYNVDTLASLYHNVSSGLKLAVATHKTFMPGYDEDAVELADAAEAPAGVNESVSRADGGGETYLRQLFEDTAHFASIQTNERGEAEYRFQLPDNITSWRLTMSGINSDLLAGNNVQNVIVTQPMFLSYTLGDSFLTGDIPAVGVSVYGTGLTGDETVVIEVWNENTPDTVLKASGVSYERINIPLWEMEEEGESALIMKASVSTGASDAVRHPYQVLRTYREIDVADYYDVTLDTVFSIGNSGLTNITFTDKSRGQYLLELIELRSSWGDRIESQIVKREADKMIKEYFPDIRLWDHPGSFDPSLYQKDDGGIAILPHAESDVETTVRMMPFIMDELNFGRLKNYLYDIYEGDSNENKMAALYGLSMLYEPVLLDLNHYASLKDLSAKELSYIALGYTVLGEVEIAAVIYDVNSGVHNDDIDRLNHIKREMDNVPEVAGIITYTLFGETFTRQLDWSYWQGGSYTLKIPAQNIDAFQLIDITGEVGAVSVSRKPLASASEVDTDITVNRSYSLANGNGMSTNTFNYGDLVRVDITISYSAKDIDGSYLVTDYLPSGLKFVNDSARVPVGSGFGRGYSCYGVVEGQKVLFYDHNRRLERVSHYYYYARVLSPGTFKAEGTIVQNLATKDYFTVGEDSTVIIKTAVD